MKWVLRLVLAFNDLMKGERFVEVLRSDGWLIEESVLGIAAISGYAFDDWRYEGTFSLAGLERASSSPHPLTSWAYTHYFKILGINISFCMENSGSTGANRKWNFVHYSRTSVLPFSASNCTLQFPIELVLFKILHESLRCTPSGEGAQSL